MGSYRKGRGQEPLLKQESERRAGGLKNPRGQTDSAVTHKVESTTNSTGGCSVSYFMDECTVGFGDHATPRPLPPPSTTTARRQVSISRTSSFGQAPRKTFMAPPKHSVLPDPQILGETAQPLSRIQVRQDLGWVGLCGSWSCTAGRLGIPEGRPDGWEWVRVTGPTTLIKNGLVSLLSETLLLGLCEFPGCRGTELTERDWLR